MYKTSVKQAIPKQHVPIAYCLVDKNLRIKLTKDEQIKQEHIV